jgi:hypothetical protein
MKLCWDNIENIRLTKNGNFRDITRGRTYYLKICVVCKEEFLGTNKSEFCSYFCAKVINSGKGKIISEETRRKISESLKGREGKKHTEETKRKLSELHKGLKASDATKQKLSEMRRGAGNVMYGKHHTEETRRRISESCKNRENVLKGIYHPMYGKHLSEETRRKISEAVSGNKHPMYGKHLSEETKRKIKIGNTGKVLPTDVINKMIEKRKGKLNHFWKGGYNQRKIPFYDTYAPQLDWCEEVRRNADDPNVLEVRCTHCGKWFIPKLFMVYNRIQCINGNHKGEQRFYCSEYCKSACPIYHKSPETLMKEDAVRAGRLKWLELDREVQHELRKMVLERDNYTCRKCGSKDKPLHCHHIEPVAINPIESADMDNCITLCEDCHRETHKKDGCKYGQLRSCIEYA